jgi:hypothetical protein
MKKSENTNQTPEFEETKIQEENSSPVESTGTLTDNLPTDTDQVTESKITEEFQPEVLDSQEELTETKPAEEMPAPETEIVAEEIPVAESEVVPAEMPEPVTETVAETESAPEEIQAEATGIVAEISPEPVPADEPDPVAEIPAEEPETAGKELPEQESGVLAVENATLDEDKLTDEIIDHTEGELSEATVEQVSQDSDTDYYSYSREQLVEQLEKAVNDQDINSVKTKIALIKVAFLKKKKDENLQKYEKFMEEGGTKETFAAESDPLEEKFNEIFNIYKANKARYNDEQEKIKQTNLKKKQEILDDLKHLVSSEETLKKTYDEFKNLQERWKQIGMVPRTEINNLWQNYHFLVEKFFDKVKLNKELKDLDLKKNLEAKLALCEKTEELLLEKSILKSFKKLQKYHEEWKELGPVPIDKKDEIWERFKTISDKINDRRREHYSRVEDEQEKNLETKTALCEQAEEVLNLKNESIKEWQENTNKVNELLMVWKNVGPVPQKFNTEIWTRFKTSLDTFFSVKKEFFDKLKDQQVHNFNLKVDLCQQAEALKTSTDWRKTSNELIRLQNEWKKIGPVPKKHSDKVWKRFRAACDEFFNTKSHYFSNMQASEEENLNKKLDLINRVKEFQFGDNKSENLETLKNFQREWTEIGHVPIKEKDRIQNDFRAIINEHLDRLKISEVEIITVQFQNKVENLKNDPNSRRFIGKEKEILIGKISKFKEDINLWENNIGFLAESKNAAILKEEFVKKINKAKSELKVMEAKLKILKSQ